MTIYNDCFKKAKEQYNNQNLEKAIELFNLCLKNNPDNLELNFSILHELGHIYKILKDYDKSIEYINRAVELKPDDIKTWKYLGEIHLAKRNYEEAINIFKRIRKIKWFEHPDKTKIDWHSIAELGLKIERIYDQLLNKLNPKAEVRFEEKSYNVFISYSTKDSNFYRISEIAKRLESLPRINAAKYWEKDCGRDIIDYMEENLGLCDVFILFCSENTLTSKSVKIEWKNAVQLMMEERLRIIPVYTNLSHIPNLLRIFLGVKYDKNNFEASFDRLKNEILRENLETEI